MPEDEQSPAGPGTGYFAVTSLSVTEFRNHSEGRIECPGGGGVVLTGPNGAGKTNLLEALSFLAPGRGLRRASLAQIGRAGAPPGTRWAVSAALRTPEGPHRLGTGLDPGAPPDSPRRTIRLDGGPLASQADLGRIVTLAWLTPQMDRLFTEGPGQRRRFFDRIVHGFSPGHAGRLTAYENAMRQRARLMREGRADPVWLGSLEAAMAENGVAVAAARRETARQLSAAESGEFGRIAAFPRAELSLTGSLERDLAGRPALEIEDGYRKTLQARRGEDAAMGGAGIGPHRTDIAVQNLDKGLPADQCSTGEQKALLIAVILAQARLMLAERGSPPILLLDEVAAHLDAGRRAALFSAIGGLGAQAWMTGTDAALFDPLRGAALFLTVREGTVSKEDSNHR